ncbi:hypothetical protein Pmani_008360 [Petrolisthes manimaculis]|uniref:Uncharacterized protein n=1 Tax=Petrolisthes manimaculis TaxID=1843537 RepID=A0AAE1Q5N1_9EUCA|nr:hypothetical protein Pmani_008360 [Petrolisthes manimaculis]
MAKQEPLSPPRYSSQSHVDKATQTILNMSNVLSFFVPDMLQVSHQAETLQEAPPSLGNLQEASPSPRNLQAASSYPWNLQAASFSPRNLQAASLSLGTIQRTQDNLWDPTSSSSLEAAAIRETSGTSDVQGSSDVMTGRQVTRNESGVQERIGASGVQRSRSALYVRRTNSESRVQRSSCGLNELRLGDSSDIPGAENRSGFQRFCNESDALERSRIEPSVFRERSDCVQGRSMYGTNNSVHYHQDVLESSRSEASAWGRSETVQGRSMHEILNNEHDHDNTHISHRDERCTEKWSHELVEVESDTNVSSSCSTALGPQVTQPLTQQLDNSYVSQPEPPLTDINNASPQQGIPPVSQTNIPSSPVFSESWVQDYISLFDDASSVPDINYPYFPRASSSLEEFYLAGTHHNTASSMQGSLDVNPLTREHISVTSSSSQNPSLFKCQSLPDNSASISNHLTAGNCTQSCEEFDPASELASTLRPVPITNETSLFPSPSPFSHRVSPSPPPYDANPSMTRAHDFIPSAPPPPYNWSHLPPQHRPDLEELHTVHPLVSFMNSAPARLPLYLLQATSPTASQLPSVLPQTHEVSPMVSQPFRLLSPPRTRTRAASHSSRLTPRASQSSHSLPPPNAKSTTSSQPPSFHHQLSLTTTNNNSSSSNNQPSPPSNNSSSNNHPSPNNNSNNHQPSPPNNNNNNQPSPPNNNNNNNNQPSPPNNNTNHHHYQHFPSDT